MISRRKFLQLGSLAGASFFIPSFLTGFERRSHLSNKKLIIIQLTGGNDGLNTVTPFRNDIYYQSRPTLAIGKKELLRLNEETGLHPSLQNLRSLYDDGQLCIINNVGYPNSDRSHQSSLNFWHTAGNVSENTGWLGRYLDNHPHQFATDLELDSTAYLALKGKYQYHVGSSISDSFFWGNSYPDSALGKKLRQVAGSIASGAATNIFYLSHGCFDTHVSQKPQHALLLSELDDAIGALVSDLKKSGQFTETMIVTFSEFGRRVAENEFGGTDHGAAGNMFVVSGGLRNSGIYNALPCLQDLDEGDLKNEIDFRQVYATVLERWLSADATAVLGKQYETLNFV